MLGILLTTLIFIGVLIGSKLAVNVNDIKKNWQKYRCRPDVMMMAPMYGFDAQENLEFCLKQGFDARAKGAIAPFYTIMASFIGVLTTMLGSINSVKMIFATIVGGATTVFSEFSQRFQALMYRIQMSVMRIKFLFSRVFAVVYSILFMGMGGMRAGLNFSNTFLFRFLDTFCFDPDTPISVQKDGIPTLIPIKEVQIGDMLGSGDRVTATFAFWADGQPMVKFPDGTLVSTNHYLKYEDSWIQAVDHPDATLVAPWSGGLARPLICLNTESHTFKIGNYLFRDYDETAEGDQEAMKQAMKQINGKESCSTLSDSTMACDPRTPILLHNGEKVPAEDIQLGDHLSTGIVHGIITKQTYSYCIFKGVRFAPGTAVWHEESSSYRRVGDFLPVVKCKKPMEYCSFIVTPGATIETGNGLMFRDYMEVHDPDLEASYADALQAVA
jgi:hypothetical protein